MTWSDFTLTDEKTATAWGTLTSSNVQQHSLIIAYAAHYDPYGSAPTIKLSGVAHHTVLEIPTQPYRVWFPYDPYWRFYSIYGYFPAYSYLVAYYYYGTYYWWNRAWWYYHSGYWRVCATVVIAFADAAGDIRMEALGAQQFLGAKLRVFHTNISVPSDKAVTKVNFQRHDSLPLWHTSYRGTMNVLQDDIVVLIGNEYNPYWWPYLGLTLDPTPNTQTLLDETPVFYTWPYGAVKVAVLRIKDNGTLTFSWNYAGSGAAAIRLTPNVELRTVTFPSISDPSIFFELQTIEDAFGNNAYPKQFFALVNRLKNRRDWGVFQGWKREETNSIRDENGREIFTGWKLVEIFVVPQSFYSDVQQIPGVLVFDNYQEAKARITYHNERW